MRFYSVIFLSIILMQCVGADSSRGAIAYEAFVASVYAIEVDEYINISEPVKIAIKGKFNDDCSELARISYERSDSVYNIELTVYGKRRLNATCNSREIEYSGSITITGLSEGRYRVRINGDNNLIKYFSIISSNNMDVSSLDTGSEYNADQGCIEEIAPVDTADITIDGLNSAKNQKIPYGTPINLIVKGYIRSECRTFEGFRYNRFGFSLYVDVLARYCEGQCSDIDKDFNETYVITGLEVGSYSLYINSDNKILFEIVNQ